VYGTKLLYLVLYYTVRYLVTVLRHYWSIYMYVS